MKVIIDHDGVKREFEGPFHILLDTQSFHALLKALKKTEKHCKKRGVPWNYGWVDVPQSSPMTANTPPKPWRDEG